MNVMEKIKSAVVAILVVGTLAIESEAQGRGLDVFLPPLPPLPSVVFSYNDRNHYRDEYRPHHRPSQVCWEEVVRVERRHGGYRKEIRTVCRDRGWRGHHRDDWRSERHHRDRW